MAYTTTLLIPTHNRPTVLNRLLRFLETGADHIEVIIADSSDNELFACNRRNIESTDKGGRSKHLSLQGKSFPQKLLIALDQVQTQTVCFCGDDDLVDLGQIARCDQFLRENQDFSHARGRMLTFVDSVHVDLKKSLRVYPQYQIDMENASDRLIYHLGNYKSNFYALRRTENAKRNFARIFGMDLGRGLHERLIPFLDLLDGKGRVFAEIFMLRQTGQSLIDERGEMTLMDKRKTGADYATELTRNSDGYMRFIEDEIRIRLAGNAIVEKLSKRFTRDLREYFSDKRNPKRLSLRRIKASFQSRLMSRPRSLLRSECDKQVVELALKHVLNYRRSAGPAALEI